MRNIRKVSSMEPAVERFINAIGVAIRMECDESTRERILAQAEHTLQLPGQALGGDIDLNGELDRQIEIADAMRLLMRVRNLSPLT